jgi:NADPH:quinone reductase-like Zn-dependent oxidoreductase
MRAFVINEFGETGHVGEKPKPEAGEGQLLVRVRAAGVNAMDPVFRAGFAKDFMEHRFPLTPGLDYAGTVQEVGSGVEGFAIGDEVFGAVGKPYAGEGTFAEFVAVTAASAAHRPPGLAPDAAAALPTAGGTALAAVDALDAKPGDTIAVIGAAGGVGGFAVQLAALRGLKVIAVTRSEHADYVRELGASDFVDYHAGSLAEQLGARVPEGLTGIIDVFHDAAHLVALVPAIKPGGRIATPAAMGVDQAFGGQPVTAVMVRAATDAGSVTELGRLAEAGRLNVPIEVLPLDQAADAIHRQSTRGNRGKLVLTLGANGG